MAREGIDTSELFSLDSKKLIEAHEMVADEIVELRTRLVETNALLVEIKDVLVEIKTVLQGE